MGVRVGFAGRSFISRMLVAVLGSSLEPFDTFSLHCGDDQSVLLTDHLAQ